jgi:hypothetical protein
MQKRTSRAGMGSHRRRGQVTHYTLTLLRISRKAIRVILRLALATLNCSQSSEQGADLAQVHRSLIDEGA